MLDLGQAVAGLVSGASSVTDKPIAPGKYIVTTTSAWKRPFRFYAEVKEHGGVLYLRADFNKQADSRGIALHTVSTDWIFEEVKSK